MTTAEKTKKDLESIIYNIDKFLKIMGEDLAFIYSEKEILFNEENFIIDIVLFNRETKRSVLVKVQHSEVQKADIEEINKWVQYWDENERKEEENSTQGLILCKKINNDEIDKILEKYSGSLSVSTYSDRKDKGLI